MSERGACPRPLNGLNWTNVGLKFSAESSISSAIRLFELD